MLLEEMIDADTLCTSYRIPLAFLHSLHEHGLLTGNTVDDKMFIEADQLPQLEKIIHLHYELDINIEGIEAIFHLLNRVHELQRQVVTLRNLGGEW